MEQILDLGLIFGALGVGVIGFLLIKNLGGLGSADRHRTAPAGGKGLKLLYRLQPLLAVVTRLIDRVGLLRRPVETMARNLRMKLLRAGSPGRLTPKEFVAFKILAGLVVLFVTVAKFGLSHLPFCVAGAFFVFYWPSQWLNEQAKRQSNQIISELPDTLDLLALMIGAGLDLGQAIAYYVRDSEPTPLKSLLEEARSQMALGRTRADALEYLARKADVVALSQTVSAFIQAEQLGASIGDTLKAQASDMRDQRLQRVETNGQIAALKMLAPLLLCIVPCVGLILFGPIIIDFLTGKA